MKTIAINVPEEIHELISEQAQKKSTPMGRFMLEAWIRTLQPGQQKSVRSILGPKQHRTGKERINPLCDNCGVDHKNMPTMGPWHDRLCPQWRSRGYT